MLKEKYEKELEDSNAKIVQQEIELVQLKKEKDNLISEQNLIEEKLDKN